MVWASFIRCNTSSTLAVAMLSPCLMRHLAVGTPAKVKVVNYWLPVPQGTSPSDWLSDDANWHEAPWNQLCLLLIVNWAGHQACFYQHNMIRIYYLGQINAIKKIIFQWHISNNAPIRPSESLLKSPSGWRIIFFLALHKFQDTI